MKINKQDYIGMQIQAGLAISKDDKVLEMLLNYDDNLRQTFGERKELAAVADHIMLSRETIKYGLTSKQRNYVFTASAREVIDNIKVTKALTPDKINKIRNRVYCLNYQKGMSAVVWKQDDDICLLYMWDADDETGRATSGMLSASLNRIYELTDAFREDKGIEAEAAVFIEKLEKTWRHIIQMLIFLELTDPEIEVVKAGKKHSQRPFGTSNTTGQDVYIVNSTWNKYIVREEGFGVRGHFRMQPCGTGRAELRLVWVSPYTKTGITRKPQREAA